MRQAPWVKRIDLSDGACSAHALDPQEPFVVGHVERDGKRIDERIFCEDGSWFSEPTNGRQWLMHGSVLSSGSALYVFMEYPQVRHAELEAALVSGATEAASVYADWLEEQGDPFAATLKPELAKERGPAGLWFMEGLERTGQVSWSLRDGFVREVVVSVQNDQLLSTLHRLCHLRACVALEKVVIVPLAFRNFDWGVVFQWTMWKDFRWPVAMKTLEFRSAYVEPPSKELLSSLQKWLPGVRLISGGRA